MQHAIVSLLFFSLLAACGAPSSTASPEPVVYGVDDRVEPFASTNDALRAVAETSIAMLVGRDGLDTSVPTDIRLTSTTTLGDDQQLCTGVAFADQPDPGECSGTLIDAQHVLTAGHCVTTASCTSTDAWVFGYRYTSAGTLATLTSDDVYGCARVVTRHETNAADYAIVELDRAVVGHTPAMLDRTPVTVGTTVALIGHPDGIPMKIAGDGHVISVTATSFVATVDAFAGNSGSGAFDDTGHLRGILDSGNEDYVRHGSCYVVNVLSETSGDGETLTMLDTAITAYCATGIASPLCGGLDASMAPDAGTDAAHVADAASPPIDASAPDAATTPSSGGGCCSAIGHPTRAMPGLALVLALVIVRRRRRAA